MPVAGDLRKNVGQVRGVARFTAAQQQSRLDTGMVGENAHQFEAGVSGRAEHRGFEFRSDFFIAPIPANA